MELKHQAVNLILGGFLISTDSDKSWEMFFTLPDKDGNDHESRPPSDEVKQAYEAIGYKLVEIEINET